MKTTQVAATLYTLRAFCTTPRDPFDSLAASFASIREHLATA